MYLLPQSGWLLSSNRVSEVTRPDGTSVGVGAEVSVGAFCMTVSVAGGWVAVSFADPHAALTIMKNKTINNQGCKCFPTHVKSPLYN